MTKKKRVRNAIRLHFDRFAVQPDGADEPCDTAVPAGAEPQEREQQQQHRRGLSSSLSSTVTGPALSEQGDVPSHDVIELFSTEYLVRRCVFRTGMQCFACLVCNAGCLLTSTLSFTPNYTHQAIVDDLKRLVQSLSEGRGGAGTAET